MDDLRREIRELRLSVILTGIAVIILAVALATHVQGHITRG